MIISKTPYRISFFGGGTDYPSWYKKNGGFVISATIDKYIYISCRTLPPFFKHKYRIVWSHIETVKKTVKLFETFPTAELCAEALTSENTEKRRLAHSAFKLLPHLVYNYNYYLSPIIDLIREKKKLFIIRQEFYKEDFKVYYKYICDINNIKENKLELFLKNKRNNTDKYNNLKKLSVNSIQNIKTKINDDYIIFNKLVKYDIIDVPYFNTFK